MEVDKNHFDLYRFKQKLMIFTLEQISDFFGDGSIIFVFINYLQVGVFHFKKNEK